MSECWSVFLKTRSALQAAERLQLEILNNIPRCEGQTTWCARGSATSIDYALASDGLVKVLQRLHIDEEGTLSIGSDPNRLRLDFFKAYHREPNTERRVTPTRYLKYLPGDSLQTVAERFEASPKREEVKTYEEYVSELCRIMEMHKVTFEELRVSEIIPGKEYEDVKDWLEQ
ncbi:hypothetical protein HPB51_007377 [Rhipicephalus microplus]|uniref:Uncharacterized protein n=1 Tax=Rhipicephalus microplus TaxID=6941 RepID=A0A9J6EYJ6_RHIMP|nr:hypothetical protein HPB51_007377 [Rhipicephalus microplus]